MLNALCKAKYGYNMKSNVRLTALIKSYDVDIGKKASVFNKDDLESFLTAEDLTTPYWIVRKVINQSIKNIMYDYYRANLFLIQYFECYYDFVQVIARLSYFGGLRLAELMELKIENMISSKEGLNITHARVKQRSDKKDTRFIVPRYYKFYIIRDCTSITIPRCGGGGSFK